MGRNQDAATATTIAQTLADDADLEATLRAAVMTSE
jgi:hypothetical protein